MAHIGQENGLGAVRGFGAFARGLQFQLMGLAVGNIAQDGDGIAIIAGGIVIGAACRHLQPDMVPVAVPQAVGGRQNGVGCRPHAHLLRFRDVFGMNQAEEFALLDFVDAAPGDALQRAGGEQNPSPRRIEDDGVRCTLRHQAIAVFGAHPFGFGCHLFGDVAANPQNGDHLAARVQLHLAMRVHDLGNGIG